MKDEINEILHSLRHGRPTDQVTDEELALEQWKQEIEAQEAVLPDHELAMRIARVPQQDALLISRIFQEEEVSRTDRQLALRLNESDMPPNHPGLGQQPSVEPQNREMVERVIAQHTRFSAEGSEIYEASKADFTCVACQEHHIYFNIVQMSCSHCYCRICLVQLFETSLKDQSLFPPQCCRKVIPLSLVRTLLGISTSQKVVAKEIEINDVYRTYCFNPTCSTYIFPYQRDGNCGTCPDCKAQTCIICKESFHQGKCVEKVPDEVMLLARTEGWKRCSRCQYMVELSTGCNHITYAFSIPSLWPLHTDILLKVAAVDMNSVTYAAKYGGRARVHNSTKIACSRELTTLQHATNRDRTQLV